MTKAADNWNFSSRSLREKPFEAFLETQLIRGSEKQLGAGEGRGADGQ